MPSTVSSEHGWVNSSVSDDCGATSTFYVDGEDYHNIHDIPAPDKCGDEVTVKLICENSCGKNQ
jgi:hypothetical protein